MAACILTAVTAVTAVIAHAAPPDYWPRAPHAKTIFVTGDSNAFPSLSPGKDPGGSGGAIGFAVESLAGLASLSSREGKNDALVWIDLGKNAPYDEWLRTVVRVTKARRVAAPDPMRLIADFARRGIVKGYILFRADRSARDAYSGDAEKVSGYTNSANAATGMASVLRGILVEESAEPAFQALGLKRLFDARDKTEEWFFDHYRDRCSRSIVHVIDPKVIHNRSYAIAVRSLVIFGTTSFTDRVYRWLEPNTPAVGWNGGDEYKITSQMSRWAKFNTASNWCMNLTVIGTVHAGTDIPWSALRPNRKSAVDPLSMKWESGKHYTSFVLSDGDNLQWEMGNFTHHPYYWGNPNRGAIPFGWTSPVSCASQIAVPVLSYLARTATPNDSVIMAEAGGYIYHDEYAKALPNPGKVLEAHVDQIAERMQQAGIHVLELLAAHQWDSPESREASSRIARRIPGLAGILTIQYYPYNGGYGGVFWVKNKEGETIPVVSARYAIWAHAGSMKLNGPPAFVADKINSGGREGPVAGPENMEWTIVHAWSSFKPADGTQDLSAEEVDESKPEEKARAVGGYDPVRWAVSALAPHVRVVTPEELVWRMRLYLKTRETLDGLARRAQVSRKAPASVARLNAYRKWLRTATLGTDDRRKDAFARLKAAGR